MRTLLIALALVAFGTATLVQANPEGKKPGAEHHMKKKGKHPKGEKQANEQKAPENTAPTTGEAPHPDAAEAAPTTK